MENAELHGLAVVLVRPQIAENVGSVARACANMGCRELVLVAPEHYDAARAEALATSKGREVLAAARFENDVPAALAPYAFVMGTTARTGGWRKSLLAPEHAAARVVERLSQGARAALVFGPEDAGLANEDTRLCGALATIPTSRMATSLNLSQAALLLLYECFKASKAVPFAAKDPPHSRPTNHGEREALYAALKDMLAAVDFLKDDNVEYWMLPVRRFMERVGLKRSEFNLLMGFCRQVNWAVGQGLGKKGPAPLAASEDREDDGGGHERA